MQGIKIIMVLFFLVGISACGKQELLPSEYVSWVNDKENNLLKEKTVHPLRVEVLYKPIPYIIIPGKGITG